MNCTWGTLTALPAKNCGGGNVKGLGDVRIGEFGGPADSCPSRCDERSGPYRIEKLLAHGEHSGKTGTTGQGFTMGFLSLSNREPFKVLPKRSRVGNVVR